MSCNIGDGKAAASGSDRLLKHLQKGLVIPPLKLLLSTPSLPMSDPELLPELLPEQPGLPCALLTSTSSHHPTVTALLPLGDPGTQIGHNVARLFPPLPPSL
jgi:hypothetical protein